MAGFIVADVAPLEWKCVQCGQSFLATGDKTHERIGPRGFPMDEVPR